MLVSKVRWIGTFAPKTFTYFEMLCDFQTAFLVIEIV